MIAFDTETNGLDLYCGAKPFFVTTCQAGEDPYCWEWEVHPATREPQIPKADIFEIVTMLEGEDKVAHNSKFDVKALATIDPAFKKWDWAHTDDTLIAAHILASNQPKNLTDLVMHWLGVDIQPAEEKLKVAVKECRRIVQQARLRQKRTDRPEHFADWAIAEKGRPDMPSAGEETWSFDYWLPRAMAKEKRLPESHSWWTVLAEYSTADSAATVALWQVMKAELKRRDLWEYYQVRLRAMPLAHAIEGRGVVINRPRLIELVDRFQQESEAAGEKCVAIAKTMDYELTLPKAGNNNSLLHYCFGVPLDEAGIKRRQYLNLPVISKTEKGAASLDKGAMETYEATLEGAQLEFIKALRDKRKRDTSLAYMEAYVRYWRPIFPKSSVWFILHPSLNPTGTDALRWSSNHPNSQNVSKLEGFNLRYAFGPGPGREWWSLDGKNLERRIPAYEAEEEEIIALLERPEEPPYYGSEHGLVAHLIYAKEFESCRDDKGELDGRIFKKKYASTLYQWVKNFNFSVQYGAQRPKADATAHRVGAYDLVKKRFWKQEKLNQHWINFANKHGYVETIPDKTVNSRRGYPLLVSRTEYGKVLPTVPLNYHVQGTACWWMQKAMARCYDQLEIWNEGVAEGQGYYMALQIHDELVFDFPKGTGEEPWRTNLPKIRKIQRLMEEGGVDIGIPTPVSVEYHAETWSEGRSV